MRNSIEKNVKTEKKTLKKLLINYFALFFVSAGSLMVTFFPYVFALHTDLLPVKASVPMCLLIGLVQVILLAYFFISLFSLNKSER